VSDINISMLLPRGSKARVVLSTETCEVNSESVTHSSEKAEAASFFLARNGN
jgi:hypothetical protein